MYFTLVLNGEVCSFFSLFLIVFFVVVVFFHLTNILVAPRASGSSCLENRLDLTSYTSPPNAGFADYSPQLFDFTRIESVETLAYAPLIDGSKPRTHGADGSRLVCLGNPTVLCVCVRVLEG